MNDDSRPDALHGPNLTRQTGILRSLYETQWDGFQLDLVIPCWNYGDYLAETLPYTLLAIQYFPGRRVVVTSHEDVETQAICRCLGVEYLATDAWTIDGAACNKGAAINRGLEALDCDRFVLLLDADCALIPAQFAALPTHMLIPSCLYGADRIKIASPTMWDWARLYDMPYPTMHQLTQGGFLQMDGRSRDRHGCYVPRGYFQLFYPASGLFFYEDKQPDCDGSDLAFALQWAPDRRILLTGQWVYHLDTDAGVMGRNWTGRKSPRFRGGSHPCPDKAEVGQLGPGPVTGQEQNPSKDATFGLMGQKPPKPDA